MHGQVLPDAVDLVLQMLLKAADLTHTTIASSHHLCWVARLEEEMFRQVPSFVFPEDLCHCCLSLTQHIHEHSTAARQ